MAVAADALDLPGVGGTVNEEPAVVAGDPNRRRDGRPVALVRGDADEELILKLDERAPAPIL